MEAINYENKKIINLSETVYEITNKFPDVIELMKQAGFESISKPGMINTAGRFMTIPKGAKIKNISLDKIIELMKNNGYEVIMEEKK